jgi:hypothetical protein
LDYDFIKGKDNGAAVRVSREAMADGNANACRELTTRKEEDEKVYPPDAD